MTGNVAPNIVTDALVLYSDVAVAYSFSPISSNLKIYSKSLTDSELQNYNVLKNRYL